MIQRSPGCDDPDPSGARKRQIVPGARGPSEGNLIEREEEKEEEEKEEEEEEATESVESDTACSLWEIKTKTMLEKCDVDQNKQIVYCEQHNVKSNTTGTHSD